MRKEEESSPDLFDRIFGRWPDLLHRPMVMWPAAMGNLLQVEEYRAEGELVIRAEIPGIDPERDVEVTLDDDVLRIEAERREEETKEDKNYYRREFRYGSLRRSLQLPEGVTEADITATYRNGVLEVRVKVPQKPESKTTAKKIPVS
ncbi:MAG TPA: Hsp20/alpha crystallin family protein [Acidimicrobiales bacterium]|nr:Hsp20/alpha crystallin family protein [Acidimicrobiales bacterium]